MVWCFAAACTSTSPGGPLPASESAATPSTVPPAASQADASPRTRPAAESATEACVDPPEATPPEREQLERTIPKTAQRFGPVVCMADREVWFDAEGRMRVCTVAKPVTLHGISMGREAYTLFYPDGAPEQTSIARLHELPTASGLSIPCDPGHVSLSQTQRVEHCVLARSMKVGGITLRKGQSIAFHHGGELAGGVVHRAIETPLAKFPAGTRLHWHPSGALAGGWLAEPLKVGDYEIRWEFAVHENGVLATFDLVAATHIQGHDFPQGATIHLRSDGSLFRAKYESDSGFMPHGELWSDTRHVQFDCDGKITSEHEEHFQADQPPPKFRK